MEWKLPYQPRMINDRDPGHQGPVCPACAPQHQAALDRAGNTPMLTSPYGNPAGGGKRYRSPHYGTYLHWARVIEWACASGQHGPVRFS